ncbi:MAG: RadC family protein [Nitrospiria bacterium]
MLLYQKNKVIRDVTVSQGSLTATVVHPREVFNPAVRDSAASVIFLHNHPSGDPAPSNEDKEMTERLVAAGSLLGIQVLDHVVIGSASYFSFADSGYIMKSVS